MAEVENYSVVPLEEIRGFVVRCMEAVGTRTDHSEALAELLVTADHRGHFSHGLNRLGKYMYMRPFPTRTLVYSMMNTTYPIHRPFARSISLRRLPPFAKDNAP